MLFFRHIIHVLLNYLASIITINNFNLSKTIWLQNTTQPVLNVLD